nr:amino acid ABC transporter permease [Jatrophihabitans endophyticus]
MPLRRPGRWVAAVVILALLVLFVYGAATNDNFQWGTYGSYLFDKRISTGAWVTVQVTFWSMVIGIGLGVLLAVMRMTSNPVLQGVAWLYLWIFRGTPVYVQLVFWGLFTSLYPHLRFGIPFGPTLTHIDIQGVDAAFFFAIIGLGLNEAAYMAEIVRAGITSVGEGQSEAATALGMSWPLTMRRIVLPQAMRVIIPPTGNELISMLKTTSLVTAVPLASDLYNQAHQISGVIFRPIPLLLVAATWYLAITSVLMVGQYFLEKRFARGMSRKMSDRQLAALADALGGAGHNAAGGM